MRVLVVEDDRALGLFLQKGLQIEGHDVVLTGDGDKALQHAEEHRPDLIVLDLSLPGRDGTEVLEAMRGRFNDVAVLVLTGRTDVEERVRCLNLGADDYLVKPCSFHELTARCRAVLRRSENFADSVVRYEGLELNRMDRKITCDGQSAELTPKEFVLLEYLLQRRGQCCSRSELMREVWQSTSENGTNVVDVYINYLRRKLKAVAPKGLPGGPVVETVRGAGYRLRCGNKPVAAKELHTPLPLPLRA